MQKLANPSVLSRRLSVIGGRLERIETQRRELYEERIRLFHALAESGWTQPEIAEAAGMTRVAVAVALHAERQRQK